MLRAIVCGIIGVAIGCGFTFFASLTNPLPWTLTEVMIAVGIASFLGPFGTALGSKKQTPSTTDSAPT